MIYSGLFPSSTTTHRINEENGKMGLEPAGGGSVSGVQEKVHHGANPEPLRRPKTVNHQNRRFRLRYWSDPVTTRQRRETASGGLPLQKVPTGGYRLRDPRQGTIGNSGRL